jgi:large conductance mechanosensitive channel
MKRFFNEFKTFALRGNMIDLAVGIVIGTAFNNVVNSIVNNIMMPPIGALIGKVDFSKLFVNLSGGEYATLADAQAAGAATLNYGMFINALITFVITALAVFFLVRGMNKLRELKHHEAQVPVPPTKKICEHCFSEIDIRATRCPACTSELK